MGNIAKYPGNNEQEKPIEVIGYVTSIDTPSDLSLNEEAKRRIVFNGITRDGDLLDITADLKIADYIIACKAHKEGVETKLTGTIRKMGAKWILSSFTGFHIIDKVY